MLKNFCTIIFLLFLLPITTEIGRLSVSAQNYAAEIELDDVICTGNGSNNNYPDYYDPEDYPPGTYNPYDDTYNAGASYLSWFLTPATVCLAIPLYEQWNLLKKNIKAVALGITAGVLTSLVTVLALSVIMGLSHADYVTLLPKSITTAIGMGVSEELGGYVTITVAVIVVTGVLGNILGEFVCKIFRITEPISKGLALGSSAHAIGTAKAIEMGEVEGAMSSLAIAVAGILTVIFASVFANFY